MITDPNIYHYSLMGTLFVLLNSLIVVNYLKSQENIRYTFTLLILLVSSILFGIRGENIGLDTNLYSDFFLGKSDRIFEPIFPFLKIITNIFTDDPQYFLLLVNVLINVLLLQSFKKISNNYPLALAMLFSSMIFINININIIRQGLAIALSLYAIASLLNKEKFFFGFFLFLAIMTHYSALFIIVIYWVRNIEINRKNAVIYLFSIFLLSCFNFADILYFFKDYSEYLQRIYWYFHWAILTPWKPKHVYFLVFMMILFYTYFSRKVVFGFKLDLLIKFYLYGISLIFILKGEEMVVDRVFYYFFFIGLFLIMNLVHFFKQKFVFQLVLIGLINVWYMKTIFIQYPNWFITLESIRI